MRMAFDRRVRRAALAACVALAVLGGVWNARKTPAATPDSTDSAAAGAGPAANDTASPVSDRVTVEHQTVEADVTVEQPRARASANRPSVRRPAPAPKEGFLGKMRRVLFGGGRHKPSPFPAAQ